MKLKNGLEPFNMKPECNVNVREIGNIVNEMMADKNKTGRAVFEVMTNEEAVVEDNQSTASVADILRSVRSGETQDVLGAIEMALQILDDIERRMDGTEMGEHGRILQKIL